MRASKIIIHHSLTKDGSTVSWNAIRKYHMSWKHEGRIITHDKALELIDQGIRNIEQPWKDIGYHMGIELVGDHYEALLGRAFDDTGAHTRGQNGKSWGVCFIGNFDVEEPSEEMLLFGIKYIKALMRIAKMGRDQVFGHCEFSNKSCPGKLFSMDWLRNRL